MLVILAVMILVLDLAQVVLVDVLDHAEHQPRRILLRL